MLFDISTIYTIYHSDTFVVASILQRLLFCFHIIQFKSLCVENRLMIEQSTNIISTSGSFKQRGDMLGWLDWSMPLVHSDRNKVLRTKFCTYQGSIDFLRWFVSFDISICIIILSQEFFKYYSLSRDNHYILNCWSKELKINYSIIIIYYQNSK